MSSESESSRLLIGGALDLDRLRHAVGTLVARDTRSAADPEAAALDIARRALRTAGDALVAVRIADDATVLAGTVPTLRDASRRYLPDDPLPLLDPPADLPRPAVADERKNRVRGVLPAGATDPAVLLAAFGVVLGRHAGPRRFAVAVDDEAAVVDLTGTFRDVVGSVRHDRFPLAAARTRFVVTESPTTLFGHAAVPLDAPPPDSPHDLVLRVRPDRGTADLDHSVRITGERATDFLAQYRLLLEQVLADPDRPVDAYPLHTGTPAAHTRPVDAPGPPVSVGHDGRPPTPATSTRPVDVPGPDTPAEDDNPPTTPVGADPRPARPPVGVPTLLDRIAGHDPGRTAVEWGAFHWTYAEITGQAGAIAGRLAAAGVVEGDVVALHAARLPVLLPAILGILRAGAAFAVLDAAHPVERNAGLARSAGLTTWIDAAPGRAAPFGTEPVLRLVGLHAAETAEPVDVPYDPDRTAYLTFTSGTTGVPRVVAGTGGPLDHFLHHYTREFGLGPDTRGTVLSGLGHDPFLRDLFAPLWAGGTTVFPDFDIRDTERLAEWLRTATLVHITPGLAAAVARVGVEYPRLRVLGFGGEPLRTPVARRWAALAPAARHLNLYGTTETPQAVSIVDVTTSAAGVAPIGPGFGGLAVRVVDTAGRPAAVGELGEVVVHGHRLARYVDGRGTGGFGDGHYRTGDLGRVRPDGSIDLAGRSDDQVKIRGHRLSPTEVEGVLLAVPDVTGAHVAARPDRLVAWITADRALDAEQVRDHLARVLPDYAVPAVVVLDEFPLTPRGKIDRAALPEPAAGGTHVAPTTPAELRVARLWQEVLGVERVGLDDDFFALGGHSLLLGRLRAALGVDLGSLFEHRTVRAQAALAPAHEVRAIARAATDALSATQERLWFEQRLDPASTAYHMAPVVHLRGDLDPDLLERALQAVVDRHPVLRTAFPAGPTPTQVVVADVRVPFTRHDLRTTPDEVDRHLAEVVREPFDLTRAPLLRARLLRIADDEHLLAVVVHHIVFDGWSIGVLLTDLADAYIGRGKPEPLAFADFTAWEKSEVDTGPPLDRWADRLAGAPTVLDLPTDRPRPAVRRARGARHRLTVPAERLHELARTHDVTLFTVLITAYAVVLARWSGRRDLLVAAPVANRARPEFEDVIGPFLNTLVLRVTLDPDAAFGDAVRRVHREIADDLAHQEVPFGRLVTRLDPDRDLSRTPLAQVLFALQNTPLDPPAVPGLTLGLRYTDEATAQADLALRITDTGTALEGRLDYDTDLFDAATAARFADHYATVLALVAEDPGTRVDDLDPITPAERRAVLETWNDTTLPADDATLRDLLTEHAGTALWWRGEEISYADLHTRAGRLATALRAHGVGPDVVVAVHLHRSPELIVALLAVLKAGGAYLPLDPDYPVDRLRYMLADSGARVLIGDFAADVPTVPVDVPDPVLTGDPGTGPDHLAYVIYTSGSTGRPKGVQVAHRSIVNRLRWMRDDHAVTAADRILQKTPTSFDVSVWELFLPLVTGAVLVIAEPGGHRDPAYLSDVISRAGVTITHFVPPLLATFLAAGGTAASLRLVVCSGEALPPETVHRFADAFPGVRLENLYGPTEAAVDVTAYRADPAERTVPIGRPVANTRVYVLDDRYRVLPVGVAGELYLGGVQVARGYGGRPGLTADRFVPDPYGVPGDRLYRTGDLARWRADGVLEYLGRTDDQVKLRGFRIELGEVAAALGALPGVAHAVAVVREDRPGDRRLVGYVTPAAHDPAALRAALARDLPDHLVPAVIVPLDALPLSPSGKVDRAALPAPVRATGGEPPRAGTETVLADLWRQVLDLPGVGRDDDFFAVGGDSLHAVRVVGLARDHGLDLTLQDLFRGRTLAAVAGSLTTTSHPAPTTDRTAAFGLLDPADLARLTG
ncbi:hypothetical protein GCM10022243_10790 [Saccharothrix violaceirubra]|uniref:Amino acid adenylation domain-containing protein n=1 Tax=Saccharothrix violaceirubra TaxID=413306 RepID=A0A7W7T3U3_9PSEU|nr:non-ribosomal peptide synthetase [Saccharothrix violaceirubra]MBB4966082.1 amino acid adenylation domain-containing protein [Saccharothrix violaceirubra]